jgi:hypothetical protein
MQVRLILSPHGGSRSRYYKEMQRYKLNEKMARRGIQADNGVESYMGLLSTYLVAAML